MTCPSRVLARGLLPTGKVSECPANAGKHQGRGPGPLAPVQTETPMITSNTSEVSELPLVVPSLPKGSQSGKHLYSANSPAARLA